MSEEMETRMSTTSSSRTYEEIVRERGVAEAQVLMLRAKFVAASEERDADVREAKFVVEHQPDIEKVQALTVEVNAARAALEERWVKVHEDLLFPPEYDVGK